MNFRKIEFFVGLFMVVGILAAVTMALQVAGLVLSSSGDTYAVKAKFDNIGSLKLRAPVRIGGVVVGRVEAITLDKEELVPVVTMSIETTYNQISSESKAAILTAGIIGEQYIGITPGFYDEEFGSTYLKDGDFIHDTTSSVQLEELISKFLYSTDVASSANGADADVATEADNAE